jgi:hypothetical protein
VVICAPLTPRCPRLCVCLGPHSKIWSTKTGQELHSLPHKHIVRAVHVDQVQRTAFSPARLRARTVAPCPTQRGRLQDGAWCATGGYEKQLRLFDLTNYHARTTKGGGGRVWASLAGTAD